VSDIVEEIKAASEEQAEGIDQINSAVAQMDKGTQQNAAMVQEGTAAAESVTEQAKTMTELVERFNIGEMDEEEESRPRERAVRADTRRQPPAARREPSGGRRNGAQRVIQESELDTEWKDF
jgi:hypothetical protein